MNSQTERLSLAGPAGRLEALRDRPATRKMVVLSATANPQVRRHCESVGADGVLRFTAT